LNDPSARTSHELDVVVLGLADEGPEPVLAIGEAKWNEVMSVSHLDRLRHIRDLLAAQGRTGAADARLLCFSGAGFTDGLVRETEAQADVALVGPTDLYTSSADLRPRFAKEPQLVTVRTIPLALDAVRGSEAWGDRILLGSVHRRPASPSTRAARVIHPGRKQRIASLVLKMSVSLDGYVAPIDGEHRLDRRGRLR
jgi:hypothetical protein